MHVYSFITVMVDKNPTVFGPKRQEAENSKKTMSPDQAGQWKGSYRESNQTTEDH